MIDPIKEKYKYCPQCASLLSKKLLQGWERLVCNKCGFIYWGNPKPVTSAIIEKDNNILLIKRSLEPLKGYWCLPGGIIEYDELPEKALIREVKEETHLDVKIDRLITVSQIDNDPRGISIDIIYKVLIINGEIQLSEEHSEYEFFPFNSLPAQIAYKHREAITLI